MRYVIWTAISLAISNRDHHFRNTWLGCIIKLAYWTQAKSLFGRPTLNMNRWNGTMIVVNLMPGVCYIHVSH